MSLIHGHSEPLPGNQSHYQATRAPLLTIANKNLFPENYWYIENTDL